MTDEPIPSSGAAAILKRRMTFDHSAVAVLY